MAFFTGCAGLESYISLEQAFASLHATRCAPKAILCLELGPTQGDKVCVVYMGVWGRWCVWGLLVVAGRAVRV